LSPSLKRIRWRLIWSSILALVLALASFALNQWVYTYSDDQCFWKAQGAKVKIQEILPDGVAEMAGILEGDELQAIQGRPVTARTMDEARRFINDQPKGKEVLYLIRRNGRQLSLLVRLVKPFNYVGLSVLLSGLVAWAIGLLVVVSAPQRKVARHFFYMGAISLILPIYAPEAAGNVPIQLQIPALLLSGLTTSIAAPLWLHFFLRFPHPFSLRRNRTFLVWLYGVFLAAGFTSTLVAVVRAVARSGLYGDLYWTTAGLQPVVSAFRGLLGCCVLSGVIVFWLGALKLPRRRRLALMAALFITTAICVDLAIFSYLNAMAQGKSLLFQREAWIFFAPLPLLPLSFAYAILRHGFFDVRRAILRWLTYFAVVGVTLTVYFIGLSWAFEKGIKTFEARWVGVLAGLSAWPIGWVLRWLLAILRKKFHRDISTARDLILGILQESKKRLSVEALLTGLADALREAFHPHVLLLLPVVDRCMELPGIKTVEADDPRGALLARPLTLRLPLALIRNARDYGELAIGLAGDEADWIREQGWEIRARVDSLEAQVMVLLLAGGEPHTAVLLGGKYAELNYGKEDRELLREVAVSAGILLETAMLHQRLLDQGRIEQELQTARRIQEGLITSEAPPIEGFDLALRLEPALETGGDLLWMKSRADGKWLAAVGDVSGKGLAAALYMSQATALLEFAARQEGMDFSHLLHALDQTMRNLMRSRDFLTLCLLEWDSGGHYRIARAGHPAPLLIQGADPGDALEILSEGRGLGLRPCMSGTWQIREGDLRPGEWLVMYSDGLTEAVNQEGTMLGLGRFMAMLQAHWCQGSVHAACEAVFQEVSAFETQDRDDRTLFILGRHKG
jgi:serine phosphatase RsbU (regulator of sigma subunit)